MVESRILRPGLSLFNSPISVQRKIGKKVRGVSETHGYRNVACPFGFACHAYGISALCVVGTHSQLCIVHYKYRYAAGKNDFLNWFAHQTCTHTWRIFFLKRHLTEHKVLKVEHRQNHAAYKLLKI